MHYGRTSTDTALNKTNRVATMDRETEQYYDNLFEMFGTRGWKQFVEEIKKGLSDIEKSALYDSKSETDFNEFKGRATAYKLIANYELVMRRAFEDINAVEAVNADL